MNVNDSVYEYKVVFFAVFSVNLREVREIRLGKNSKDFDKWPEEARKYDTSLCFVIFYGSDFKLKTLSVVGRYNYDTSLCFVIFYGSDFKLDIRYN